MVPVLAPMVRLLWEGFHIHMYAPWTCHRLWPTVCYGVPILVTTSIEAADI